MKNAAGQTAAEWKRGLTASIMAFGLALGAGAAPAYQAQITASGYAGESTLTDFPVLVRISPSTISGFAYAQCADGGADLSFALADGTVLSHEIDTWNTEGESTVWVKIPSLAKDTAFMMRWGDSAVTVSTSTNAAWNSNYVGVWHLGEADGTCANSTSAGAVYDATPKGAGAANSVRYTGTDAPVGSARTTATSAAKSYLSVPSYDAAGVGGTFTMSGWVRFDSVSGYPRLFSRKESYNAANGWEIEMQDKSYTTFNARGINNNKTISGGTLPTLQNSWVHVALVYDGATLTVCGNGGETVSSAAIEAATDNAKPLSFGCDSDGSESYVIGQFDECRLLKGAASADWVKAEYDTVKSASFLTYGGVQAESDDLNVVKSVSTSTTTATIHATVLGVGTGASTASVSVRYGTSANNLSTTVALGSASAAGVLSTTLTGLLPEATYYAQIVATNNKGEEFVGQVFSFVTQTNVSLASDDLDGTGGDTLTLSGSVSDFSGTCTLKVLTGASADELDDEWTTSDLGAGATLSAPGDFALSLCEKDTASARYLTPGSTVYVRVEATADGRTTRSAIQKVVMSGDPVLKSSSTSQTRKKVTFTAQFSDLGMGGKVTLALWYRVKDTGDYVKADETEREVTSTDSFSFVFDFPEYSTSYDYELRVTSASAGGTVAKTASVKTANVTTKATPPVYRVVPDEASKSVSGWENASTDLKGTIEGVKEIEAIVELMNGRYVITNQITHSDGNATEMVIRSVNPETGATDRGGAILDAEGKCRILYNSRSASAYGLAFANGHATSSDGGYGGAVQSGNARLDLYDCVFTNNYAEADGGAIGTSWGGQYCGTVSNCLFVGNSALAANQGGGAIMVFRANGAINILGCDFIDNSVVSNRTSSNGGWTSGLAVHLHYGDKTPYQIRGCTFRGNKIQQMAVDSNWKYRPVLSIPSEQSDRVVADCRFEDNFGTPVNFGGTAVSVTNCVFTGNEGGVLVASSWDNTFVGCAFTNNVMEGLFPVTAANAHFRDCLIAGNTFSGDFLSFHYAYQGNPTRFENCTISGNEFNGGNGLMNYSNKDGSDCVVGLAMTNTIFYGNTLKKNKDFPTQVTRLTFVNVCTDNSVIQAKAETVGGVNIVTNDPLFADAAAGDYRLKRKSPCREAGVWLDWMTGAVDLAGNPRVLDRDGRVSASALPDLGCYECTEKTPGLLFIIR